MSLYVDERQVTRLINRRPLGPLTGSCLGVEWEWWHVQDLFMEEEPLFAVRPPGVLVMVWSSEERVVAERNLRQTHSILFRLKD
jgi:hypothetical protein